MPLLIDGHNLIGAGVFEDISLQDEHDEALLVSRLRVWQSSYRGMITVIFDHGITGGTSQALSGGGVKVIFARNPQDADGLIRRRIRDAVQDLTVVTNDRALRREASLYGVDTWRADEFVAYFSPAVQARNQPLQAHPRRPASAPVEKGTEAHVSLSDGEISEWMALFGPSPRPAKRPTGALARPTQAAGTPQSLGHAAPSQSKSAFQEHTEALRKKIRKKRKKR